MCNTVAIFRSMNGYSEFRIGGTGARAAQPVRGLDLAQVPFGMRSAGQNFAPTFMRHMYEYGTTSEQVAHVQGRPQQARLAEPQGAPEGARHRRRTWSARAGSCKPLHLLDCCLETDNATCAHRHLGRARARPAAASPSTSWAWPGASTSRAWTSTGRTGRSAAWPATTRRTSSSARPASRPRTSTSPAPTTPSRSRPCSSSRSTASARRARAAPYVSSGIIELGGKRPNNTSGGHLCEGYTHGMSMVIENVRQLRGTVDDYCPGAAEGKHTYDYSPGRCRQVKDAEITMNLGWAMPATGSALHPPSTSGSGLPCPSPSTYRGMTLRHSRQRQRVEGVLRARARQHKLMLRACKACGLMRYPPTPRLSVVHATSAGRGRR